MKFKLWLKIVIFLLVLIISSFLIWQRFFRETRELEIQNPIPIELVIDGFRYEMTTSAKNIGDFFKEKNIEISEKDSFNFDKEEDLRPFTIITLNTNRKISIAVDGSIKEVNTIRKVINKILKDEGIKLNPFDKIKPGLNELAQDTEEIIITRIEKKNVIEKEEIEFETIIKEDKKLSWKKQKIEQEGKNGLKEVEYELVYKNGDLVSKTKLSSKVIDEPKSEIIIEGRKIEIASTQKGLASWYAFKGGMYCASVRYPKGTWLRVTSRDNGKQIIVQVNDYGPDPGTGKVIDLDKQAFGKLMSIGAGVINVKIEEIKSGD